MASFFARGILTGTAILGLAGCSTDVGNGQADARIQAGATPVVTATNFTESLSCMDDLLARMQFRSGTPITNFEIVDATGKLAVGGRAMLIRSMSLMTRRSDSFHYIDIDPKYTVNTDVALKVLADGLLIQGTISELNNNVLSKNLGGGAGTHSIFAGTNDQQMANAIAVDMSLEHFSNHEIIPSTATSNTLTLVRRDRSVNIDGQIGSPGLSFSYSDDTAEGEPRGVRTLIELTVVEMIGKYYKLPYWQCLGITDTDPRAGRLANEHYINLKPEERVAFDANGLRAAGYYTGPDTKIWTDQLRAAAAQYGQAQGAVPTGLENFELFFMLLKNPSAGSGFAFLKTNAEQAVSPAAKQSAGPTPLVHATIEGVKHPSSRDFQANLPVTFEADLTGAAYFACFYQDAANTIFRVYPSPTQPSEFLGHAAKIKIPGERDQFRIRPTVPNSHEKFACFAAPGPILSALPGKVGGSAALEPLAVSDLDEIKQILARQYGPRLTFDLIPYSVGAAAR